MGAARAYAPYIVLPFAVAVGTVGYFIETRFRKNEKWAQEKPSTLEERTLRQIDALEDPTKVQSLKYKEGMPQTIFERNQGYKTGFTGRSMELGETSADSRSWQDRCSMSIFKLIHLEKCSSLNLKKKNYVSEVIDNNIGKKMFKPL